MAATPTRRRTPRSLAGWRIDVEGRPADNPLIHHYPYWPGSLALLAAVEAPLRALGRDADPRVLYLLVYCALGLWLGRWSLRERGHLGVALAVCLNPLLLPYLWQGANDILLVAGMAVAAVALAGRRVVLAGLALGAALSVKAADRADGGAVRRLAGRRGQARPSRPRPRLAGGRRHRRAGRGDGGPVPALAPRRLPQRRRRLPRSAWSPTPIRSPVTACRRSCCGPGS